MCALNIYIFHVGKKKNKNKIDVEYIPRQNAVPQTDMLDVGWT